MRATGLLTCCAAVLFSTCLISNAAGEDSILSKLNPFGSKSTSTSTMRRPMPGSISRKKKPEPSMASKIGTSTKTAWDKTTTFLSPKHLFSTGSPSTQKAAPKKNSSNWGGYSTQATPEPKNQELLSDWLKLPHNNP